MNKEHEVMGKIFCPSCGREMTAGDGITAYDIEDGRYRFWCDACGAKSKMCGKMRDCYKAENMVVGHR